jgi:hypothetical protein
MIGVRRPLAALATSATLAVEGGAIVALTALGHERRFRVPLARLDEWVQMTPPADALVAGLRWVALVGAWWLLAGTVVYVVAAATRVPAAVRAVRWVAFPVVRRVVDAAFVATVIGGAVVAPAPAGARAADPPPTTLVRDGRRHDLASLTPATTAAPAPATATTSPPPAAPSAVLPPSASPAPDDAEVRVVVAPGDDLWELAADRVAAAHGLARAALADADVAPYWVVVCERNRTTLASGDPNLIFPGEVVTLPAVS